MGTGARAFLSRAEARSLTTAVPPGLTPEGLFLGPGSRAIEIAVVGSGERRPTAASLKETWKARANKGAPVVVAAIYGASGKTAVALCGPVEPDPPVHFDIPGDLAERICEAALEEPTAEAARRFLDCAYRSLDTSLSGVRNEGLLATHHLERNVPGRSDFAEAVKHSKSLLGLRDRDLLRGLGFEIEVSKHGEGVVLRHGGSRVALAVLVQRGDDIDAGNARFNGHSPISYGLVRAVQEGVPYVLVLAGPAIRLYATDPATGAARRGNSETFLELRLDLVPPELAGYLSLFFSAGALAQSGTAAAILAESKDYAAAIGVRLRERIYERVVPAIARGVVKARHPRKVPRDREALREAYEISLTILFRLLFIAYAEDRGLLPHQTHAEYRQRSLKSRARELASRAEEQDWSGGDSTIWNEITALFQAVDKGNARWGVPAYNGGLFSARSTVSPVGAAIAKLQLADGTFGPILEALLVDPETPEGRGPVDFRSLGVRDFGTIYEGLLESELGVAPVDLTLDGTNYRPLRKKAEPIEVEEGEVYLHKSGARKASGSYFTKPMLVDHLLEQALEPTLAEHLNRLDGLDEIEASAAFFDFRIADLAMGSGHFLVAAIDRIERAFSSYLVKREQDGKPLRRIRDELARLREEAKKALPEALRTFDIEDGQLLRRQIARHCIFGVDLNQLAVDLARLSIWLHTFVPGLPLSLLDRSLVRGNSLIGVGTLKEADESLGSGNLFAKQGLSFVAGVRSHLERVGRLSDANTAEIESARDALLAADGEIEPLVGVLDYVVAGRIDPSIPKVHESASSAANVRAAILDDKVQARVRRALRGATTTHFPVAFPQVFDRKKPGFDVILGNPPWEEVTLEHDRFWLRFIPGLQGMKEDERDKAIRAIEKERPDLVAALQREQEGLRVMRESLLRAGYPGMGTGDPDLYKGFLWRFWHLIREGGRIGVVLPRVAFQAKGGAEFRRELFEKGEIQELVFVLNRANWVFEEVEPRYTIVLAALRKLSSPSGTIGIRGPFTSMASFEARADVRAVQFTRTDVLSWTDTAALPLLPSEASLATFAQIRKAPRLDLDLKHTWRARPYAEFHATNDKKKGRTGVIDVSSSGGAGALPVFKGETFDLWMPDNGTFYGWADADQARSEILERIRSGTRRSNCC